MKLKSTSQFYYKVASAVLIALFVYFSVMMFNAQTTQLMLIIVIFSRLWPRVTGIQGSLEQIASTIPSFKAVIALQEECNHEREFFEDEKKEVIPLKITDRIQCDQVYFSYYDNERSEEHTSELQSRGHL